MKTRTIMLAIMAILTTISFTSCEKIRGKGEVITEARSTDGYSGISLAMSATVFFTSAPTYSLELHGQENVLRQIVTEIDGNQLVIRVKHGVILGNHEPVRVYITAPNVTRLEVSGSGDIFTDQPWHVSELSLSISGSGNITLANIEAGRLAATISGSGNIKAMAGTSNQEDLKISGSGSIDLRSVEAHTVFTRTSGSGEMFINATNLLDVTISGSGDIWYLGNPSINLQVSGSGSVKKL